MILNFIENLLNPISIVLSIILAIPVFWTWYEIIFAARRRQKRMLAEINKNPVGISSIFIVDLNPHLNIYNQVIRWREEDSAIKIPNDRIYPIVRQKDLALSDSIDLISEIRKNMAKMAEAGVDTIYLFYSGPVAFAAIVGAELANKFRVFSMQYHNGKGKYENWGKLKPEI